MKTWPALAITAPTDLLQAALVDFEVAAIDDNVPDTWRVFFHTAEERDRARTALGPGFPASTFSPLDVPDEDWAARSQASLHAVQVGRIVVAPPWDVVIRIQPSMGFGTGHHATTRLCLAALQQLELAGRAALDVGTGSGVLAIAASLLGAAPVVAVDDDPDAVQSARENVGLNGGARVDVQVVDLRTADVGVFDVVLANLTGGLLIQAAARLQALAGPSGALVVSGFMAHEEAAVLAAFQEWGPGAPSPVSRAGRGMGMRHAATVTTVLALLVVAAPAPRAERMGYPPEEFAARRARLAAALEHGTLVMFGATDAAAGLRFRQDNDFFYLTGNEALNAILVMDAPGGQSHLFIPKLSATEIRYEGGNWLEEADAANTHRFASIQPLSALPEFLARRRGVSGPATLWTRLSERDEVNIGRIDTAIRTARRLANPFAPQTTPDAARIERLRAMFPYYVLQDATPHIDALRLIKTPREIEILRANGRISAEAMRRAIAISAPGRYEYEFEAEATQWMLRHGLQSPGYPAIVASGPNGNQWHYESNGRQTQAGDLIVMDYGGSLDYLTIDITRTWPVSGRFTDAQRKAYDVTLAAQKAIIAAIRPGVTRAAVRTIAEDIFRTAGFDPRYAYVGHYVGLSVHDVGDWNAPFQAGMVMAIEPILDIPEQQLHVRVEDTILVTATGAEVLTSAVPKEVDELLRILARP